MEKFVYDIFISYSHANKNFALKLYESLIRYRSIFKINGKGNLKVFLDRAEADRTELSEGITKAIQSTEKLIVICSTASKNSNWVNKEIELFYSIHGGKHIIPILIEGEPATAFGNVFIKMFPEDPWAPDFREIYKVDKAIRSDKAAWFHLLSSIYEVPRKVIERRELWKRIYRGSIISIIVISLVIFSSIIYRQLQINKSIDLARQAAIPSANEKEMDDRLQSAADALRTADTKQAADVLQHLLKIALARATDSDFDEEADTIKKFDHMILSENFLSNDHNNYVFAYSSDLGSAILLDLKNHKQKKLYCNYRGTEKALFTHNGKYLFTCDKIGNGTIWNVEKGTLYGRLALRNVSHLSNSNFEFTPDDLSIIATTTYNADSTYLNISNLEGNSIISMQPDHPAFETRYFYDTLAKNVIFQSDETDKILIYNYTDGKKNSVIIHAFDKYTLIDAHPETKLLLVKRDKSLDSIPYVTLDSPDSFAIVTLNTDKQIISEKKIQPDSSNFSFLMRKFPYQKDIRQVLCNFLIRKFSIEHYFSNDDFFTSPNSDYVIGIARPDWNSTKMLAYVFDIKNLTLIDSSSYSVDNPNSLFSFFAKLKKIPSKNSISWFWNFRNSYQQNILEGLGDAVSADGKHVIHEEYINTYPSADTARCFIKIYDWNGNCLDSTTDKIYFSLADILDSTGKLFIANDAANRGMLYLFDFNKRPSIQKMNFQAEDSALISKHLMMLNKKLSRKELLEIVNHWLY
jgi:hypothetical protein